MNNNFWTKTTSFKLFGKYPIFVKEEICSDVQYEGQIYQVQIKQDYYNQEFDIKEKPNEHKSDSNGL